MMNEQTDSPPVEEPVASSDPTDQGLIAAIASGDEHALRTLYDRHAPWLAARLRRMLPASAVEDVLQETFLAAWRSAPRFQPTGAVGAWLWGIGRRQAALWLRAHGRSSREIAIDPLLDYGFAAGADPATVAVDRAEVQCAFAVLGPATHPSSQLAHQVFVEDRPLAEVARNLRIPEGTVKSRLHKIRRVMQDALGSQGKDEDR